MKLGHRGSNFVFILPYLLTTVLSGTNEHLEIFTTNAPCLKSFTIEIQGRIEFAENTLLREKKHPRKIDLPHSQSDFIACLVQSKVCIYIHGTKKFRVYAYKFTSFCGGKNIYYSKIRS